MDTFQRDMIIQSIQRGGTAAASAPETDAEVVESTPSPPYRKYLPRALLFAALLVFLFWES